MRKDREVSTLAPVSHHSRFDTDDLIRAKGTRRVSVCIPARDEESTVGAIVRSVSTSLGSGDSGDLLVDRGLASPPSRPGTGTADGTRTPAGTSLVDEILVVDDGSRDHTARVAFEAGARVLSTGSPTGGKGQAMRLALAQCTGDLVVFLDADVRDFSPHFVTGLVGPLLVDDGVALVKGFYERSLDGRAGEGGRVTELVARPVIDLLFPHLSVIRQPLAGETAAPRSVLGELTLADGYGVELGMLIDVAHQFGVGAVAQVDLGTRVHRNRPLAELRNQATEVLRTALERSGSSRSP